MIYFFMVSHLSPVKPNLGLVDHFPQVQGQKLRAKPPQATATSGAMKIKKEAGVPDSVFFRVG